jgi:GNAT superfamily N-acetyltransferase
MPSPPYDSIRQWTDGDYVVTTDPARYDVDVVTSFLANDSYWAKGRTHEQTEVTAANSRCYSLVHVPTGRQVGGARAVTDHVAFAWIADVFVLDSERGHGLGKFLVQCITDDLSHVARLFLGTWDAHGLYAQFGFARPDRQERWMERLNKP